MTAGVRTVLRLQQQPRSSRLLRGAHADADSAASEKWGAADVVARRLQMRRAFHPAPARKESH